GASGGTSGGIEKIVPRWTHMALTHGDCGGVTACCRIQLSMRSRAACRIALAILRQLYDDFGDCHGHRVFPINKLQRPKCVFKSVDQNFHVFRRESVVVLQREAYRHGESRAAANIARPGRFQSRVEHLGARPYPWDLMVSRAHTMSPLAARS